MPLHETPPRDPLSALLAHPPAHRAPPPPPSLESLESHAAHNRWADVLSTSTHLLTHTPAEDTLSIHTYRILALLQTRQTHRARQSLFHLTHAAPEPPATAPFLLGLLALDLRLRLGDAGALPAAFAQLRRTAQPRRRAALRSLIAAYALRHGLPELALDAAEALVAELPELADAPLVLARVLAHRRDFEGAEAALRRAERRGCPPVRLRVERGLLAAGRGLFREALALYDAAIEEAEGGVEEAAEGEAKGEAEVEVEEAEGEEGRRVPGWWVCAMNNSAVCLLQLGLLQRAVERLENAICRAPESALQEGLVFNLATLYQLAFPDDVAEKKRVLRKVAERFGRQGFDLEAVGL